ELDQMGHKPELGDAIIFALEERLLEFARSGDPENDPAALFLRRCFYAVLYCPPGSRSLDHNKGSGLQYIKRGMCPSDSVVHFFLHGDLQFSANPFIPLCNLWRFVC